MIGQFDQSVIPLAGVIHPEHIGADDIGRILPDSQCHGNPGACTAGMIDQDCSTVLCCCGTNQYHTKPNAKSAVLDYRLAKITVVDTAAQSLRNTGTAVLNRKTKAVAGS